MASKYQTKVINHYKRLGYKAINLISMSESGIPDLMMLKKGKAIFIECKEEKDTLSSLQKVKIDELIKLGFEAFAMQQGKGVIYPNDKSQPYETDEF